MSKRIQLPSFLSQLVEDSPYNYVVHEAIRHFSEWYKDSTLPFFPDYTNHGVAHLEEVMTTAEALIPSTAKESFSDADAVALVLAVLLHDSALHLSKDGFWELIKGGFQSKYIQPFDKQGWQQTWDDFFFFARRWDDNKLSNVFGTTQEGAPRAQVRDPFDHWDDLGESDRLLIGEFIRQQHPRIAHEMAVYGIPGNKGTAFSLNADFPDEWRNLVGLIARSHGLALRPCVDYLEKEFGRVAKREYQNIHAVYLMALLRIADYIQIQPSRTSTLVFQYKNVSSKVSGIEHKVHLAVKNITNKGDDPESIHIDAHPGEVAVFLRLKEWLAGIQSELDASWAVLGEVYGLQPDLRNLGLLFRRVRSNLDDVSDFATKVSYVPDRIRFDVARAELLKLLIGPLYGDDPSYGVRELMQNSIDAVREYEQFVQDHPEYADVPRREQDADVLIELSPLDETGHALMTISDRGIGMKEEVIRDYFLKAGASYRQSSQWRATFESDDTEGAKSKVLRSGRFGVGALAAFLIGKHIDIETKHVTSDTGFHFETGLDNEIIEIQKTDIIHIGTKITISINKSIYDSLSSSQETKSKPKNFDWYKFSHPIVIRKWDLYSKIKIKTSTSIEKLLWRKLDTKQPYDVYWTIDDTTALICNGIYITDSNSIRRVPELISNKPVYGSPVRFPSVSVFDNNGLFPLNLERNYIRTDIYPFGLDLLTDLLQEMLAWLFYQTPSIRNFSLDTLVNPPHFTPYISSSCMVNSKDGFGIRIKSLLNNLPVRHIINIFNKNLSFSFHNKDSLIFNYGDNFLINNHRESLLNIELSNYNNKYIRQLFYIKDSKPKNMIGKLIHRDSFGHAEEKLIIEYQNKNWFIASSEGCPQTEIKIDSKDLDKIDYNINYKFEQYEEIFLENTNLIINSEKWLLDDLRIKFFNKEWIPFDLKDRIAKFYKQAHFFYNKYPHVIPNNIKSHVEHLLSTTW